MKSTTIRLATSLLLSVGVLAGTALVATPASAATVRTTTITTYRTRRPSSRWHRWSRVRRHHRRSLRARHPFGDRDRDGVPNIVDRRPRNPRR